MSVRWPKLSSPNQDSFSVLQKLKDNLKKIFQGTHDLWKDIRYINRTTF